MKTKHKKHKLGALLILFILSTSSFCISDYMEVRKNINDLKADLAASVPSEEKKVAKNIVVKKEGIQYKDDFIPKTNNSGFRVMTVRLTVYWAKGGSTDGDSARLKSSTGYTLRQGESIAVDPKIIPYTKEVIIPNIGLVKAVDTGTAVREKRASSGKMPVIDVFFVHKKDALAFASRYPKIVNVAVLN